MVLSFDFDGEMNMSTKDTLDALYPGRVLIPASVGDIPKGAYMVYVLTYNDKPVVVGHGRSNRAKVIFDDRHSITSGHIKAFFVRVYHLLGQGTFERFLIPCGDKSEAETIEKDLHDKIKGNTRELPQELETLLLKDIEIHSPAWMALRMAQSSSFDGLSDLRGWRKLGILCDQTWKIVSERLQLSDPRIKQ